MNFKPILLAAGLTLALSAAALAEHGGGWHHGPDDLAFLHGLTLTDAQKSAVHDALRANWAQMKPLMEKIHATHEQIETGFLAGQTAEQLSTLVAQEEALRTQMDSLRLANAVKLRGILTPAQLSQAAQTHAKMAALHAEERAVMGHGELTP